MQGVLEIYAEELKKEHDIDLRFRVGLNTGPVVVGKVHDDLKMDYTAHGDTANLAARMEAAAEPGSVYLTNSTYKAVKDYFEFERIGEIRVKGREQPVVAYKALRTKPWRTRFEVAAEHGLTRFVGREHELELLNELVGQARKRHGQVLFLSGEALILERINDATTSWGDIARSYRPYLRCPGRLTAVYLTS